MIVAIVPNIAKPSQKLSSSVLDAPGTINTIVGNGLASTTGDGGPANIATINKPIGITTDSYGDVYVVDSGGNELKWIPSSTTKYNYGKSNIVPGDIYNLISESHIRGVAVDGSGNIFISAGSGLYFFPISTCNSNCYYGLSSYTAGILYEIVPNVEVDQIALDGNTPPDLYYADDTSGVEAVDKFSNAGVRSSLTGSSTGGDCNAISNGMLASTALLNNPYGLVIDSYGNVVVSDSSCDYVMVIAEISTVNGQTFYNQSMVAGRLYIVAGTGTYCASYIYLCGDGGLAVNAQLSSPESLALDAAGNIFVADRFDNRIREVTPGGLITTVAGTGSPGYSGDLGQGTQAMLNEPLGVAIDQSGNLYISDSSNNRVREVYAIGIAGPLTKGIGPTGTNIEGNSQYCSGDPVNCADGNYYKIQTDINIPFRDLPLKFTRTYNSLSAISCSSSNPGLIGCGWSTNLSDSISFNSTTPEVATVATSSGATAVFTCSNSNTNCSLGTWQSPSWQFDTLTQNGSNFNFQVKGNLTYVFSDLNSTQTLGNANTSGVIIGIKDLNGYVESYNYCQISTGCSANSNSYSDYQLENVVDPASRNLWISYQSGTDLISSITDPAGRSVNFTYDTTNGNLSSVSINGGANFSGDPIRTWSFSYSTPSNHLISSITNPNNLVQNITYYSSGQADTTTQVCATNDSSCNSLSSPNRTYSYSYTSYTAGASPNQYTASSTTITDPNGNVTLENFIQNTLISETDGLGSSTPRTIYYQYSTPGNTSSTLESTEVTDPNGNVTQYQYNGPYGEMTQKIDPLGRTTNWTYNSFGELTSYEAPLTTAETDPVVTYYNYDSSGNLDCEVTITNQSTPTDPACSSIPTNPTVLEPATLYTYGNGTIDSNGTVGATGTNGGWPGDVVQTDKVNYSSDQANITSFSYDQYGDLMSTSVDVSSGVEQITTNSYDIQTGTLTCSVAPNGYSTLNTTDTCQSSGNTTQYTYNDLNQVLATLNPQGGLTLNSYDSGGRLISTQIDPDAKSFTPDDTSTSDSDSDQSTVGPEGTTTYGYDSFNEQITVTSPPIPVNGGASSPQITTKTYDHNGNLLSVKDANGNVTSYTYDSLNRMATMTAITGTTTNYKYDPASNLIEATYSTGISNFYSYDSANELVAQSDGSPSSITNLTDSSCNNYVPFYGVNSIYCGAIGTSDTNSPAIVLGTMGSFATQTIPSGITALSSIACPSQTDCIATGLKGSSPVVIETTNGSTWSDISSNLPSGTTSVPYVNCPTTTDCYLTAVVGGVNSLVSTTNFGTSFTSVGLPSSFNPTNLTCPSSTECYLIGTSSTSPAIYQYSSGVFTAITIPSSITSLEAISCSSTTQCVATGQASGSVAIIATTNSTIWTALSVPSGFTDLNSVSCPATTNCYATGSNGTSPAVALITYSNSTWAVANGSSSIAYGTKSISSVGCGISSMCVVLGQGVTNGSDISSTSNSGTTWTNQFITNLYTYDQDGHQLSLTDGIGTTGSIAYTYDPLGRLTSQINEYNVATTYNYDLVSNMTSLTYPNGQSVLRTFNAANELTSVTTWLPGAGTCGSYSITNDTTSFTYDLNGNLSGTTIPDCDTKLTPNAPDTFNNSYDGNNFMTNLTGTGAGKNFSTVYADNGLGVTLSRTVNGGTPNNYTYNAVGNITSASSSSQSFQYDQNSNITCNQSGQNLTYNSYNEVTDAYSTCGSTATLQDTFSYDSNGDRIQEMFPWNGQQVPKNYGYNSLGQMTYFSIFDTSTNYTYSGTGQLMYENQGSTVLAQMTYNEATSTPEIISNGTYYFIYGPNNQVFETIDSTTPTYLLLDNLGSALADFAQNGTISNLTFYNTFGDSTASSTAPPIGFDNAYYDSTSGLYYLLNRFYDPTTSQFLTIDPRTIDTGIPYSYAGMANPVSNGLITTSLYNQNQSQPYEFVNNNPIDGTDMSGLCPCNSRQLAMKGALIYGGSLMAATGTLGIGLESAELGMLFSGLLLTTGPLGLFIVGSASLSFIAFQMYDVYDQASHVYGVSKTCH